MIAWRMYANENAEFPPNEDYNDTPRWVAGDMRGGAIGGPYGAGIDATNWLLMVDPHYSCMGPYISNAKVMKCPADQSTWSTTKTPGRNEVSRVRTYSMNQAVGPAENGQIQGSQDTMGHWLLPTSPTQIGTGGSPWKVFY
jgi:hypothetical protein